MNKSCRLFQKFYGAESAAGDRLLELVDSWIILNLMNKAKSINTEDPQMDASPGQSAPRKREKRIISRKSQNSEKSIDSRRFIQRTPKVNEFTPRGPGSYEIQTPQPKKDHVEPVPRLSFNESQVKSFITYQPLWKNKQGSDANIQSARELPKADSRTEREAELKHEYFSKKIDNLKTELEIRNQEIQVIEEDRQRLRRNNQELARTNTALQAERKQLRLQIEVCRQDNLKITTQKKKLQREKETLEKKIIALQKCSTNESWSLQSNRERYLEREIQELRQRLSKSKSQMERLLQNEVNRYKEELFNSLRTVSALMINNDCIQKKLHELSSKPEPVVCPNEEYLKLRNKYKKFLSQYRSLRKEYDDLKEVYDEIKCRYDKINMDKSETLDEDTSLDLSDLN